MKSASFKINEKAKELGANLLFFYMGGQRVEVFASSRVRISNDLYRVYPV
jgi:hypothetical protein